MSDPAVSQFLPLDPALARRFVARALAGLKPRALELLPSARAEDIKGIFDFENTKLLPRDEFDKAFEESCERGDQLSNEEWDDFFDELESIAEALVAAAVTALNAVPALAPQRGDQHPTAKSSQRRESRASTSLAAHREGDSERSGATDSQTLVIGRVNQLALELCTLGALLVDGPKTTARPTPRVRQVQLPAAPSDIHRAKARKILQRLGRIK
ncbi:MAG TPA: hypothetical protein PKD61_30310 [Polyangiaceae bacterium]|nr:hypothetical protein [Polyangiaceae bacterium]